MVIRFPDSGWLMQSPQQVCLACRRAAPRGAGRRVGQKGGCFDGPAWTLSGVVLDICLRCSYGCTETHSQPQAHSSLDYIWTYLQLVLCSSLYVALHLNSKP